MSATKDQIELRIEGDVAASRHLLHLRAVHVTLIVISGVSLATPMVYH